MVEDVSDADRIRAEALVAADRVVTDAANAADHLVAQAADVAKSLTDDAVTAREVVVEAALRLTKTVGVLTNSLTASNRVAEELGTQIGSSNARIAELSDFAKHNRSMIWAVIASLVVDVCLTVGLGFAYNQAHNASITATKLAQANTESQMATCQNANGVRANDIVLWTHVLNITSAAATPAQQIADAQIQDFVDRTFAPRKCT